jgi:hypothetical protein
MKYPTKHHKRQRLLKEVDFEDARTYLEANPELKAWSGLQYVLEDFLNFTRKRKAVKS